MVHESERHLRGGFLPAVIVSLKHPPPTPACGCAFVPPVFCCWLRPHEEGRAEGFWGLSSSPPAVTPQMLSYLHICRTNSFFFPTPTLEPPPPIAPMRKPAPHPHYRRWKASVETNAAIILLLALTNTAPPFLPLSLCPLSLSLCPPHPLSLSLFTLGLQLSDVCSNAGDLGFIVRNKEESEWERVTFEWICISTAFIRLNGWGSTTPSKNHDHRRRKKPSAGAAVLTL